MTAVKNVLFLVILFFPSYAVYSANPFPLRSPRSGLVSNGHTWTLRFVVGGLKLGAVSGGRSMADATELRWDTPGSGSICLLCLSGFATTMRRTGGDRAFARTGRGIALPVGPN